MDNQITAIQKKLNDRADEALMNEIYKMFPEYYQDWFRDNRLAPIVDESPYRMEVELKENIVIAWDFNGDKPNVNTAQIKMCHLMQAVRESFFDQYKESNRKKFTAEFLESIEDMKEKIESIENDLEVT